MDKNLNKICYQWITKNNISGDVWYLNIYFGTCKEKGLEKIARFIFDNYPSPMLRVAFNTRQQNQIETIQPLYLKDLSDEEQSCFADVV